jgi:hypothetical protein
MNAGTFMMLVAMALALALVLATLAAATEPRVTEADLFLARLKADRQGAASP